MVQVHSSSPVQKDRKNAVFFLRSKKVVRVTVDGEELLAVNCVQNSDQTVTMTGESFIIYKK